MGTACAVRQRECGRMMMDATVTEKEQSSWHPLMTASMVWRSNITFRVAYSEASKYWTF